MGKFSEGEVKGLFLKALEKDSSDWASWLREACPDPGLRREVSTLLRAHERAEGFLEQPGADDLSTIEGPGSVIGRYKVLQKIGEGGFGVVYMAEQTEPVKRKVALKIIKLGMDTKQVVARFEAERQALALMDHGNIAKVLDGGATDRGRPYFVMELVKGVPITEYCDKAGLDTAERLSLFQDVCHAVQHAHQKGIIHRDLKPTNVLVTLHDGKPVPKVIDFGIAKATDRRLTEKTLFTEFQQIIGTPEYMAPEQAEMTSLDVDTRADIYSLGVLLYELLTGTKPFDMKSLLEKGYGEILRTIREVEPPRPSTRLSTMGDLLPGIAKQRRTEPKLLGRIVRGDLDWIVMKALEKDRSRRYDTATAFADDIARYLTDLPVLATPPSKAYRLRKYVRRHRVGAGAAAAILLALLAGLVTALLGLGEARTQRDLAMQARADEAEQRRRAEAGEAEARRGEAKSNRVLEMVNEMLGAANPWDNPRPEYRVRDLLDNFDRGGAWRMEEEPEVQATIRGMLASAYLGLSLTEKALPHIDAALVYYRENCGDDHPLTGEVYRARAEALLNGEDPHGALEAAERSVEILERSLGADHLRTAQARMPLAQCLRAFSRLEEAESHAARALAAIRRHAETGEPVRLSAALQGLAFIREDRGDLAGAGRLFREALEVAERRHGATHPRAQVVRQNLVTFLFLQGEHADALELCRRALDGLSATLGADHPRALTARASLGHVLTISGRHAEAAKLLEGVIADQARVIGEDHPDYASSLNLLATVRQACGELADAERLFRRSIEIRRRAAGGQDLQIPKLLSNLGLVLSEELRHEEAVAALEEALAIQRQRYGPENLHVATTLLNLGGVHGATGNLEKAETFLREGVAMRRRLLGESHPGTGVGLRELALVAADQSRFREAEDLTRRALRILRDAHGGDHPDIALCLSNLGAVLQRQHRLDEAEPLTRDALAMRRRVFGDHHPRVAESLMELALLLRARGRPTEALEASAEAVDITKEAFGADQWKSAVALEFHAACLSDLGRSAEAREALLSALDIHTRTRGESSEFVAGTKNSLGVVLLQRGEYERAEELFRSAREIGIKTHGEAHPLVLTASSNLAVALGNRGKCGEARDLLEDLLPIRMRVQGEEHPSVGVHLMNLGLLEYGLGEYAAAEEHLRGSIDILSRSAGASHPRVAMARGSLAGVLAKTGRRAEAIRLMRQALVELLKLLGNEHPRVATARQNLGLELCAAGDHEEGERLLREAMAMRERLLGPESDQVAITKVLLASRLANRGEVESAETLLREAASLFRKLGVDSVQFALCLRELGTASERRGEIEKARDLYEEALEMLRRVGCDSDPHAVILEERLAMQRLREEGGEAEIRAEIRSGEPIPRTGLLSALGRHLLATARPADAEKTLRRCVELRDEAMPWDAPRYDARSLLGEALAAQRRFAEAEPVLVEAYEKMDPGSHSNGRELRRAALERIALLYEAWGKPEKAAEWRAKAEAGGKSD